MVEFLKWFFGVKQKPLPVKKQEPPTSNSRVLANKPSPQPTLKAASSSSSNDYNLGPLYDGPRYVASTESINEGLGISHSSHDSHSYSSYDGGSSSCDSGSCDGGCD